MDWKQVLPPLCRSRIETRFAPAGEDLPAGSSKFGGRPDVPAGFVWPVFETKTFDGEEGKPRPLAFLAQFDCARLAELGILGAVTHYTEKERGGACWF